MVMCNDSIAQLIGVGTGGGGGGGGHGAYILTDYHGRSN